MDQKGKINVKTENIFPIIKKFLYSENEIFLRELVSNGVDAVQKIKALARAGEFKGSVNDLYIEVRVSKRYGTVTVSDNGIGLNAEEVNKYINQIALSGAEEFVNKYKSKSEGAELIGHFGLGFYSSFMVADKVELITKSFRDGEENGAVKWECDGSPDYTINEYQRDRGTDVILYISEDSKKYLEEETIEKILQKYCKFLPVEIRFNGKKINNTEPAWKKKPVDLKEDEYKKFYKELYPYTFEDAMFYIHLNVDFPFNLTGILYFPRIRYNVEPQRNKIQLYCNQVFVTDSVENIVPDFMTLLHGVLDSPDIPLNVSRSYLQGDPNVKKISAHITKKVADRLEEMFKTNLKEFEEKWDAIKIFIEYGFISEDKFMERAKNFCLFKNTDGKYFLIQQYMDKVKAIQEDKDKNIIILYTNNAVEQHSFVFSAKDRGYDVLLMDTPITTHFIGKLEQEFKSIKFVRVDSDITDKLINKNDVLPSKLSDKEKETLRPLIENQVPKEKFTVVFETLSEKDNPMVIIQPEFTRRMKEFSSFGAPMPELHNLVVNVNHPLIGKILTEKDDLQKEKIVRQTIDLALLSQNLLKGEDLTRFVSRSIEMIV